MSITLILEISSEAPRGWILSALEPCATVWLEKPEDENKYVGNFYHSNMYFKADLSPSNTGIMAEDIGVLQNVKIGARVFFFVVPSQYEVCIKQITEFMDRLAQNTPAKFILSQEYETVYAVRSNGNIDYRHSFYSEA